MRFGIKHTAAPTLTTEQETPTPKAMNPASAGMIRVSPLGAMAKNLKAKMPSVVEAPDSPITIRALSISPCHLSVWRNKRASKRADNSNGVCGATGWLAVNCVDFSGRTVKEPFRAILW